MNLQQIYQKISIELKPIKTEIKDITHLKPEQIYEILSFLEEEHDNLNTCYAIKIGHIDGWQNQLWGTSIAGLLHSDILIFEGFLFPDMKDKIKVNIPFITKYPKDFKVWIFIHNTVAKEFFRIWEETLNTPITK